MKKRSQFLRATRGRQEGSGGLRARTITLTVLLLAVLLLAAALPAAGREKDTAHYGAGLIVNVPLPESEVIQVVQDIAQNGIIRGTKEYNKDEYVSGATAATFARGLPEWNEGGKVFYKVRAHALDPRNFKDGGDVGTLSVRYVVQAQGDHNTVLRIDAVFAEDFRRFVHQSNGSVESAEYKDIRDRLDSIELMKTQTVEAERERQELLAKKQSATGEAATVAGSGQTAGAGPILSGAPSAPPPSTEAPTVASMAQASLPTPASQDSPPQTLEEHVRDLRHQVERLVKSPGAPLKSAPFHSASTLKSLPSGTEVMIVISTPYWFGVETREGQHGWMMRDQLELGP